MLPTRYPFNEIMDKPRIGSTLRQAVNLPMQLDKVTVPSEFVTQ